MIVNAKFQYKVTESLGLTCNCFAEMPFNIARKWRDEECGMNHKTLKCRGDTVILVSNRENTEVLAKTLIKEVE